MTAARTFASSRAPSRVHRVSAPMSSLPAGPAPLAGCRSAATAGSAARIIKEFSTCSWHVPQQLQIESRNESRVASTVPKQEAAARITKRFSTCSRHVPQQLQIESRNESRVASTMPKQEAVARITKEFSTCSRHVPQQLQIESRNESRIASTVPKQEAAPRIIKEFSTCSWHVPRQLQIESRNESRIALIMPKMGPNTGCGWETSCSFPPPSAATPRLDSPKAESVPSMRN